MKISFGPICTLWLWAILFFPSTLFAIDFPDVRQYSLRNWQTDEGLPHNSALAVHQTRDRYLWIGTRQGLTRFDGVRFAVFDPQNTPGLKGEHVTAFCETRDGTLWIGFERGGISWLKDGQFAPAPSPQGTIKVMCETRDGTLWIGTSLGLFKYQGGQYVRFTTADGLPSNIVLALAENRDGNLWVGTSRGLVLYNGKLVGNSRERLWFSESVRSLWCDQQNDLWIGTGGGGLLRLRNEELRFYGKPEGLPDGFIMAIYEDRRGEFWIGTLSGLCRRFGEKFVPESMPDGTSYGTITSFAEDAEGSLWLGTHEGLSQLQPKPFKTYMRQHGIPHNKIMAVSEDRNGAIWMATWGGGVSRLRKGEIVTYNYGNSQLYDLLLSVHETRDGSLWLGADYDGGLYQYRNGTFLRHGQDEGLVDGVIRVLYEDRQGNFWVGGNGGLYLRKNGLFERLTKTNGLAGNVVREIMEDSAGNLWIGTTEGLSKREKDSFVNFTTKDGLSSDAILALHEDADRYLWIGTDGGGLCRMKSANSKDQIGDTHLSSSSFQVSRFTTKDGLFSDSIFEILEDDYGNLWMSSVFGVFEVSKKELENFDQKKIPAISCVSYGRADGMASIQCNGVSKPAGWKSKDGRLWFPTNRGVSVIDPKSNVKEAGAPPPVVIEELVVDQKVQSLKFKVRRRVSEEENATMNESGPPSPVFTETLNLPPGRGELEFHYTALSFRVPERNRFKYKLEGVDSDWIEAGARRVAYYNNIAPGHYTFRVQGCNNDGVWNAQGASVNFWLQPHFWQTKWFLILTVFGAIGLVAGTARYITWTKVKRRLLLLEQQHALERERTRIARDMHDELGACLTEILLLSDHAGKNEATIREEKPYEAIAKTTRDVIRSLDAIVWAVNPRNDTLDKTVSYLCNTVTKLLARTTIRCRLDVPDSLPAYAISSETRHNLFLIVKEAVNNIVKHSGASEVWFRLQFDSSGLSIIIEDNGKGFSSASTNDFGNGLQNMKDRAAKLGGTLEMQSEPGKGTRLQLRVLIRPHER